ncbi:MAG: phosphate ABC transporter substrate-binding protein PstS [Deltaproteobacteria bacterium]|nr:phosphate ABC transporter substrate-binding protein PstS [Deltaproteobacteria bacterium]MBN2688216.1 phosphate ABC transporter substrate-binding protein PstS [Deltaproteobacteria bacterium]
MFKKNMMVIFFVLFMAGVSGAAASIIIDGAGATFPSPLYYRWIEKYQKATGVRITYQKVGSGSGIKAVLDREVDFGGTDVFLSDEEMVKTDHGIIHIPTCIGAVAIIYNLPGCPDLRFTPELLADIFLGRIRSWSHEEIRKINKDLTPSNMRITVVHRTDGSGTNYLFTDYLSKVSPRWSKVIGTGKKVIWSTGIGVEKNSGVAETVKNIPGSIGYVSLTYAQENHIPVAMIKNRCGNFIAPDARTLSSAAMVNLPTDMRVLFTDTDVSDGYPIGAFTYLIFYREQAYNNRSREKAVSLARFLWWCVHEGQLDTTELFYAPLPEDAVWKTEQIIRSMTYNGEKIVTW